jgi:hypothetical protein
MRQLNDVPIILSTDALIKPKPFSNDSDSKIFDAFTDVREAADYKIQYIYLCLT